MSNESERWNRLKNDLMNIKFNEVDQNTVRKVSTNFFGEFSLFFGKNSEFRCKICETLSDNLNSSNFPMVSSAFCFSALGHRNSASIQVFVISYKCGSKTLFRPQLYRHRPPVPRDWFDQVEHAFGRSSRFNRRKSWHKTATTSWAATTFLHKVTDF